MSGHCVPKFSDANIKHFQQNSNMKKHQFNTFLIRLNPQGLQNPFLAWTDPNFSPFWIVFESVIARRLHHFYYPCPTHSTWNWLLRFTGRRFLGTRNLIYFLLIKYLIWWKLYVFDVINLSTLNGRWSKLRCKLRFNPNGRSPCCNYQQSS